MKLNKSTRYALHAAVEMARATGGTPVTVAHVAEHYAIPRAVLAKVFQQLVRAGIASGVRGTGGGYRLARSPADVTVLDVLAIFEPLAAPTPPPGDDRDDGNGTRDRLQRLLEEVDELVRCTFASVSLETLARRGRRAPVLA